MPALAVFIMKVWSVELTGLAVVVCANAGAVAIANTAVASNAFFIRILLEVTRRVARLVPRRYATLAGGPEQHESVEDGDDDGGDGGNQTADGNHHVVAAFLRQWIEPGGCEVAANEAAGVRVVVDARHEQAKDDGLQNEIRRLLLDAAARRPAV